MGDRPRPHERQAVLRTCGCLRLWLSDFRSEHGCALKSGDMSEKPASHRTKPDSSAWHPIRFTASFGSTTAYRLPTQNSEEPRKFMVNVPPIVAVCPTPAAARAGS